MLKVLHYIPGFLYGGIETMFLSWYRCIENKNVEFELLIRTQDDDATALKEYRKGRIRWKADGKTDGTIKGWLTIQRDKRKDVRPDGVKQEWNLPDKNPLSHFAK